MVQQTAVEWLAEQYKKCGVLTEERLKKAKQMEKEQTEISDEEIWKEANNSANKNSINDDYDLGVFKGQLSGFFDGAKWYREQLKQRQ